MSPSPKYPRVLKSLIPSAGLIVKWKGKDLVNFSSNNYLGLKDHPLVKKRAIEFVEQFGVGSGASRLVTGNFAYHEELEQKLATSFGYDTALLMNSGFQANISMIPALADHNTLILIDRECHNSLLQGVLLSKASFRRFRHQDFAHLRKLLQEASKKKMIVITESLFSMDGDWTDLDTLLSLKREFGAFVIVDDSHGTGIRKVLKGFDLIVGSFGKAFGCFGSYLLCNQNVKENLIQKCSGLIYSTALPPMIVGAVDAALDLLPSLEKERNYLENLSQKFRKDLKIRGIDIGLSESYIIPLIIGDEEKTLSLEKRLFEGNLLASSIRPPTVKRSRIRLSLTAMHTQEHLNQLFVCL